MDQFADFSIKSAWGSHTESFPVHRSLLCSHSCKLRAAIEECTTGELTIQHDVLVVKALLQCLYTSNYVLVPNLTGGFIGRYHANVYALAFEYDLTQVMATALYKFARSAAISWDHVGFVHAINRAYEDTDEAATAIRKKLVQVAVERGVELYDTANHSREFIATVHTYGTFAADLNAALVEKVKRLLSLPVEVEAKAAEGEFATTRNEAAGSKRDADSMKDVRREVKHDGNDSPPTKKLKVILRAKPSSLQAECTLKGALVAASLASKEPTGSSSTAPAMRRE
ncbi:hypothetical protein LTR95_014515 [Oleoguttula sp. CCFEE 5521]